MTKYWESYPPIHQMIAGYFGIKKQTLGTAEELLAVFGATPGMKVGGGIPALPKC